MHMTTIDSSLLSALGYDPETQELRATFKKTGDTWSYSGVRSWEWTTLMDAKSVGAVFGPLIKASHAGRKI